ncbi:TerD family protein [Nocardioides sp. SYSU D00038]|uniref:TerD family protein n=1 Tax=Nocardioides sp. SYSU D00038 TaxID=2812554 RepID=UPI0019686BE5|nr:TerD family protein [Nocardioides sp. SYSU D00038]
MTELVVGQELALEAGGRALTRVRMGVGWDKSRTAGFIGTGAPEIDLDASAVQFSGGALFDLAFFNHLATRDGSVVHQGDNRSGSGEGDDEVVVIDLDRVHGPVDVIFMMVSSFQGHGLEWVHNAYCRVVDDETDEELARYTLSLGVPETGLVLCKLVRAGAGWTIEAIGEGIAATDPTQAVSKLARFL